MTRLRPMDGALDQIGVLLAQRDRAIAQRAAMEAALWRAEYLLKQVVDGTRIDVAEIEAFLLEPRHHPEDITLSAGAAGRTGPNEGTGGQGDPGHVDV